MNPKECKYTQEHEWIRPESEDKGNMGLTDYAQNQLGDIVFLDLPAVGTKVEQSAKIGEIESVKAVSDLYSPVSGQVIEVNKSAVDEPQLVNDDPYGNGWLIRLEFTKSSELDSLMDSDVYDKLIAELSE
jgi:glycine cleavage system H protein